MAWIGRRIPSLRSFVIAASLVACANLFFWVWRLSLDVDPAYVQSKMLEASEAEKKGRLPEAIGIYEKILVKVPKDTAAYLRLGEIYFHLGLPTKAEEAYLKALENGLNDPDVYLYLGYIKESQGKFEQALEYYAKAELAASRNPALYFNMGSVHAQLARTDKALEYFKRAVVLNPGYMDAFVNLSIISAQLAEYGDAQYYLEKAEKLGYHAPVLYKEGLAAKVKIR